MKPFISFTGNKNQLLDYTTSFKEVERAIRTIRYVKETSEALIDAIEQKEDEGYAMKADEDASRLWDRR